MLSGMRWTWHEGMVQRLMWAVVMRTQLEEDLYVIRHVMGFSRDPYHRYKSKLTIDATFPLEQRKHFRRTRIINEGVDLEKYLGPKRS